MARIATFYDHIREISRQEDISLTEAMREAKSLGIELLEVSQNNLVGREDEVGRELAYAGLGVSSVPAYFQFGRDLDVDRQSEPVLEAAQYLGAHTMLVIPGFFGPEDSKEDRERQVENIVGCLNRLGEKAAGYGVSLVMEDFDNALSPCSSIRGLRQFLDRCPRLSCNFDTGNFRFAAEDELAAYEALKDRISHVHLKDRAYSGEGRAVAAVDGQMLYPCPVGSGEIQMEELVSRLKRDGYDGVYAIEHYGAPAMLEYLKRSAGWVKAQMAR